MQTVFTQAGEIDADLKISAKKWRSLAQIQVKPKKYSRSALFRGIAHGEVYLTHDFPSPCRIKPAVGFEAGDLVANAIEQLRLNYKVRTKVGLNHRWQYLTAAELMRKWRKQTSRLNVTDLHLRDTNIEDVIDVRQLSAFNLFPSMSENAAWIEMMTMVVSGAGGYSDSHSDDCDGSNHCFTGSKLWLAWDTGEGLAAGLEDLDQQRVAGKCAFDMDTFLSLKSACWFTVGPGQTLFMPGHYTHKVITLSPYLGVGSFYLGFPNLLRTLSRWQLRTPNWERLEPKASRDIIYQEILDTAEKRLKQIQRTSRSNQEKWGLDYLANAWRHWHHRVSDTEKVGLEQLMKRNRLALFKG